MVNGILINPDTRPQNTQKETSYHPIHTSWHHPDNQRKCKTSWSHYILGMILGTELKQVTKCDKDLVIFIAYFYWMVYFYRNQFQKDV